MNKETNINSLIRMHLASRCPFLALISWEEERVLQHLEQVGPVFFDKIYTWSVTNGFKLVNGNNEKLDEKYKGPLAALDFISSNKDKTLFLLSDYHPYISEAKITRKIRELIHDLQANASSVIFISPKLKLPMELEKDVAILDYPLPTIDNIKSLFQQIEEGVSENPNLKINLNSEEKQQLLNATLGLTENELKNVFAKALVSDSSLVHHHALNFG